MRRAQGFLKDQVNAINWPIRSELPASSSSKGGVTEGNWNDHTLSSYKLIRFCGVMNSTETSL